MQEKHKDFVIIEGTYPTIIYIDEKIIEELEKSFEDE